MQIMLSLLITILYFSPAFSQDTIQLRNPSFERPFVDRSGKVLCCKGARAWFSCGKSDSNSADAQPGNFGVELPAKEGDYYLSMVTRDDDTWEAISQRLEHPLLAQGKYSFSIALAKSDDLESKSRRTGKAVKFNKPIKLRIWGGKNYCGKMELLAESELIKNTEWQRFDFVFEPKKKYTYLTFEAMYKTPSPVPYNGGLLLDDCSVITVLSPDVSE